MNSVKFGLEIDEITEYFGNKIVIRNERADDHLIVVHSRSREEQTRNAPLLDIFHRRLLFHFFLLEP